MLGTFLNTCILLVILLYLQYNAFAFYIYCVPNGCVIKRPTHWQATDKKKTISWKSACQRASRASELGNFFAFIRTKTAHLSMFELKLTNNMTCFSVTLLHLYIQFGFPIITHDTALYKRLTSYRQNTHIEIIRYMRASRASEENLCISQFQTCYKLV